MSLLLAVAVTIQIDAAADRHPIDPRIYGVNFATEAQLRDLHSPINRSGGNATTRYNWQQNAANRASDWYFESLPDESPDAFITSTHAANAEPMITIPIIGWVARLGPHGERLSSFSIAKYGAQQDADWQWFPDAGNGVRANGARVTNNDPHDANMIADPSFQRPWVAHLQSENVRYYVLDNEHSIWQETHRDVRPTGANMEEILSRVVDYATMIKSVDPHAIVAAPEEWGWLGYLMSGYDQQWASDHGNWSNTPDRIAHGGMDYLPWLLDQLHQRDVSTHTRLLDVFTVHYYPQGGEYSSDVSREMQLRRNRSTRSLWDPAYHDETWIDENVRLIPRLHEWVNRYYPGTAIGITEYNWGAEEHMNGATAQADILGIFGREGVDIATRWTTPRTNSPAYNAIKIYRDFGNVSVRASVPNADEVAAFAAIRSTDNALTIMLINKQIDASVTTSVQLANFTRSGTIQRSQLTQAGIQKLPDMSDLTLTLPAQSVTLLVIPAAHGKKQRAVR